MDLDTGAVVAAKLHPVDEGDTTTHSKTLAAAEANLETVDAAPQEDPVECVADKGYHSRAVLKALDDSSWKTGIGEARQKGFSRCCGDEAVCAEPGCASARTCTSATCFTSPAHNLSLVMRQLIGAGVAVGYGLFFRAHHACYRRFGRSDCLIVSDDRKNAFAELCFIAG